MEAALQTGKLSMDFFTSQVTKKDVTVSSKKDEFKNIFQDKVNKKDGKFEVSRKDKKDDVSDTEEVKNKSEDLKNEDIDDKEVKDEKIKETKDKKEKKKVEQDGENENQEMTLEEKLQALLDKMDVELNEEVENTDVGESVDEVGLLTAETETITLNMEDDENADEEGQIDVEENNDLGQEGLDNIQDQINIADENSKTDKENTKDSSNNDGKFKLIDNRTQNDMNNEVVENKFDVNLNNDVKGIQDVKGSSRLVENQERINILKQVTDQIDVSLFDDKSEMVIKLKPENLGKLTVQISIENGNISAKFLAESDKVKAILESSFNQLKETLEQQGMNIQNLDVSVGNGNNNEGYFLQKRMMMSKTKISRIDEGQINVSNDYFGIETKNDVLRNYWPDSTVSFSA